jgi:molybdopterin-guanine dinucleotide biosynthesis protein A
MGEDKSFLNYHGKAQCYYMYEILKQFCTGTFISCNAEQYSLIEKEYNTLEDISRYENKGPATGVLTAFNKYPDKDFLVTGCDYPLLTEEEIRYFLASIPGDAVAAAFYDEQNSIYQPVVAWYSSKSGTFLIQSSENKKSSLQQLLENVNAYKHLPLDTRSMRSVDTKEEREETIQLINYDL